MLNDSSALFFVDLRTVQLAVAHPQRVSEIIGPLLLCVIRGSLHEEINAFSAISMSQ